MKRTATERLTYIAVDFLTANIAVFLFDMARYRVLGAKATGFGSLEDFLCSRFLFLEQLLLPVIVLCIFILSGFYNKPFHKSNVQTFFSTLGSTLASTLIIYFALLVDSSTSIRMTSYELLLYLYGALFVTCFAGRAAVTAATRHRIRKGKLRFNVAVAGNNARGKHTAEMLRANSGRNGFYFSGFISLPGEKSDGAACRLENAADFCRRESVSEIIIAPETLDDRGISDILRPLFNLQIPLKINADALPILTNSIKLQSIYEEPYIDLTLANVTESTRNIKRLFDILLSSAALIVLAVPMGVIGLWIRSEGKGRIFFRQERIGYHGKPFHILKFRTMRPDAEANGPQLSSERDNRITRTGKILRKYRLDELPQFWNVLKGDMSIVGPRPERRYFIDRILEHAPQYTLVHQVRPGITSWGMVKYGYASSVEEMVERLRYDLVYLANMSITVDVKILIYTLKTVIKGRGK